MENSGKKLYVSILFLIVFFKVYAMATVPSANLEVGFYQKTCPSVEAIVRKAVKKAVYLNSGIAAGLIRLHFHDCFVRGCDASVLLNTKPGNPSEKEGIPNLSLRGFEVIDEAKAEAETACPGTVSCADILAFAARDSASLVGGLNYKVPAGRRDGRISQKDEPIQNLPAPLFNVTQLVENFARKGLSLEEMVILSGAHSIGISHCSAIFDRLFGFNATHNQDPSTKFAKKLRNVCQPSKNGTVANDPTLPLDVLTPYRLDNKYYVNLMNNAGLLTSDQTLMSSPSTARLVKKYVTKEKAWAKKFAAAMVHMGSIEVQTGYQGEIRRNCGVVN